MVRTQMRPIPSGRMSPREGLLVGLVLGIGGVIYLALAVNFISAVLAAATIAIYLFAYTPLKRITTANTMVGAIPGAIPPLIGWAAARNDLALPAWTLFGILFFWQLPHFFAIGWMYREDYARAGFVMLSGRDLEGGRTGRQSIFFTLLLLGASVTPVWFGIAAPTVFADRAFVRRTFSRTRFSFSNAPQPGNRAAAISRINHLPAAPAGRAGFNEAMSSASALSPTKAPLSWSALAVEDNAHSDPAAHRNRSLFSAPGAGGASLQSFATELRCSPAISAHRSE